MERSANPGVTNIQSLEKKRIQWKHYIEIWSAAVNKYERNYKIGWIVAIIGLFLVPVGIGIILAPAGLLTAYSAKKKRDEGYDYIAQAKDGIMRIEMRLVDISARDS